MNKKYNRGKQISLHCGEEEQECLNFFLNNQCSAHTRVGKRGILPRSFSLRGWKPELGMMSQPSDGWWSSKDWAGRPGL